MSKKWFSMFILSAVTFIVGLAVFVYLNAQAEFSPGWTDPIELPELGGSPSLLVHDKTLLLAFMRGGDKGPEIAVVSSHNGKKWSAPYSVVQKGDVLYKRVMKIFLLRILSGSQDPITTCGSCGVQARELLIISQKSCTMQY